MIKQLVCFVGFLSLLKLSNGQCVNMWEADLSNPSINICPVRTVNGDSCSFPFSYSNVQYKTCTVNGPNNQDMLPQCLTSSGVWSACIVPNTAAVSYVTTRKSGTSSVNSASLNGGTMVWISGYRFANNLFSVSPSAATSNQVFLSNGVATYECEVHTDKVTSTQITCYAPSMPSGVYSVRVIVNGNIVPIYQYISPTSAIINVGDSSTPKINTISPISAQPGSFITINGDFKTTCYTRDVPECADDAGARITRLFFGGQSCDLVDPVNNTLYQELTQYTLTCKLTGTQVGLFNVSMLVNNEFGRSLQSSSMFYATPDEKLYNYQAYPTINSVSPNTGSTVGGTILTINGSYLYSDDKVPATITIGSTNCQVLSYSELDNNGSTSLTCQTETAPSSSSSEYIGNRGLTLIRDNVFTAYASLSSATPSASATKSQQSSASYADTQTVDVTVWLKGYITPLKTSDYELTLVANSGARLFLSTDDKSSNKIEIAYTDGSSKTNIKATKSLTANTSYYMEVVASKSSGRLNVAVNGKMLNTNLVDQVSSNVINEVQEIAITSTIVQESFNLTFGNFVPTNGTSEVQKIKITFNNTNAYYVLSFDGVNTVPLIVSSTEAQVQQALNDLPTLYPNLVTVILNDSSSQSVTFLLEFSSVFGDILDITEILGNVQFEVTELQKGIASGQKLQLVIENIVSPLFSVLDTQANIQDSIDRSFGIRCPSSIQFKDTSSFYFNDYEENCNYDSSPVNETAFCGKCSLRNDGNIIYNVNSSLTFNQLCFAYRLTSQPIQTIYLQLLRLGQLIYVSVPISTIVDGKWHYTCVDMYDAYRNTQNNPVAASGLFLFQANLYPTYSDSFVDVVSIRNALPFAYEDRDFSLLDKRRLFPKLQISFGTLSVNLAPNVSLAVSYRPNNCTYNLIDVRLRQSFSSGPQVISVSKASPPVTGTFDIAWNGATVSTIPAGVTENTLTSYLQSLNGFGFAKIKRTNDCAGYTWNVKWINGGNKPPITITSSLSGNSPSIAVKTIQDGGAMFNPLRDDFLKTLNTKPQVQVNIDGINSMCTGTCDFEWSSASTPTVTSIDTSVATSIKITGTGFDSVKIENNIVKIGDAVCNVISATSTLITCSPGPSPTGTYSFSINILGKGLAQISASTRTFSFSLTTTSFSPSSSLTGGGVELILLGSGFSSNSVVTVDNNNCEIKSWTFGQINCIVPSNPTTSDKQVDIVVTDGSSSSTYTNKFLYDASNSPVVASISPTVLSVKGGETITITGTNLPILPKVLIGQTGAQIVSSTSQSLILKSPALEPGIYALIVSVGTSGNVRIPNNLEYKFYVSSFSPQTLSIKGGSLITIYGEGFSENCAENKVTFGENVGCKIKSCTSTSIQCISKSAYKTYDINNLGSDPNYGIGYSWNIPYQQINTGDFVKWTWYAPTAVVGINYMVQQVSDAVSTISSGFSSGNPSSSGSYTYQFNKAGTYYYWSGYVDTAQTISFRGVIVVVDASEEHVLELNVEQNGFKAQKCVFPFTHNLNSFSSCTNTGQSFNWCSPKAQHNGQYLKCDPISPLTSASCSGSSLSSCSGASSLSLYEARFTTCNVATVTSVSTRDLSFDTVLTITGTGFSSTQCENEVYIGDVLCELQSSSATSLSCKLGVNSGLIAGVKYRLEVLVKNAGYSIQKDDFLFNFIPVITSMSPTTGSTVGGTNIQLNGDGFSSKYTSILVDSDQYIDGIARTQISYSAISLFTNTGSNLNGTVSVIIQVNGVNATCRDGSSCLFQYTSSSTPRITSVSPTSVNDVSTITIIGENFGTDTTKVNFKVGNVNCVGLTATNTQITCTLNGLNLGTQNIFLNILDKGDSRGSSITITGQSNVKSISPVSGSIYGGTNLVINGNGFTNDTIVMLDTVACVTKQVSLTELTCITGSYQAKTASLSISTNGQSYSTSSYTYTYDQSKTPSISSLSPSSISDATGQELTITGTQFSTNQNEVSVKIGNVDCDVTQSTLTQIKCNLRANSAGSYSVVVKVDSLGYSNNNVRFTYNLVLTSLSNTQSGVGGGLDLVVNGNGFSSATRVLVCSNECTRKSNNYTHIICQVPQSSILNQDSSCTLSVQENGLSQTSNFNYVYASTPAITASSPQRGGTGGGTRVTISGTNFPADSSSISVFIAGSKCDVLSSSTTQIICATGSYSSSSTKALIKVYVNNIGLALNDNVYFEYIDLWSSIWTWGGNLPPQAGEVAIIGPSQIIYFDANTPVLKGVIIQGGSLIFDDNQDVSLSAEYIIITDGGKLEIGTELKPFTHKAQITMYGSLRSIELPIYGSKVIALRNGTIDMHGLPVGVTWTHLESTADAGVNTIRLKEPVIWPINSEIIIATTGDLNSQGQSEVKRIISKSSDNKTLTLDSVLSYKHLSEKRTNNGVDVYIRAEVGLLSRNIIFSGNQDHTWDPLLTAPACPDGFNPGEFAVQTCFLGRYGPELGSDQFGATIMIGRDMSKEYKKGTVIARISNVELTHVGQAFRLGRYPIHFHMNGDMSESYVKECAIHKSFNRAVNIHATNYMTVDRNVIYNILGGAFFLEDGVEIGNRFSYNLAIFVRTSSSLLNEDVTPAAFWATNPNNTYIHNAVAGSTHFGWWYRILDRPDGPSYTPNYCPKKIPLGTFFNNSVHSTGRFGLWIFPGYTPTPTGSCSDTSLSPAKFFNFTAYGLDKGAEWVMSNPMQFRNFIIFDTISAGIETKTIVLNENINTQYSSSFYDENNGALISDSIIIGNSQPGSTSSIISSGLVIAWDRGQLIKNVTFINFPDESSVAIVPTVIAGRCVLDCGGWTTKFSQIRFNNVRFKTNHRWNWDVIYHDLDGSLTGAADNVVVSKNNITTAKSNCRSDASYNNGMICSNTKGWVRFAFKELNPSLVTIINYTIAGQNEMASIPYRPKRLTHKPGFMVALEANQHYKFVFDQAAYPTNISYHAGLYSLLPGQWIIISHQLLKKPDQVSFEAFTAIESYTPLTSSSPRGSYYYDNSTGFLSYIVSNPDKSPFSDYNIQFSAIRCRYLNCIPPTQPADKLPVTSRPATALNWSSIETWYVAKASSARSKRQAAGSVSLPKDYDDVIIPENVYVVVDTPLPKLRYLQIDGILELDNGIDHNLEAEIIFINGGQLIVGWEDNPILTNVNIKLTGYKDSLDYLLPDGLSKIGGKGIGVFGGLDVHGKQRYPVWTRLSTTVNAGSNSITLIEPVDWIAGETVVITTTSYRPTQTETLVIASKSSDNKTLTFTTQLLYEHLAYSENYPSGESYKIAAGVGLLSRNVKIIGSNYTNQESDLYGSRIIVSDYSGLGSDGEPAYYRGFARIDNCEFNHFGQFSLLSDDDVKYGILLSNLGDYNSSRPNYVRNSAFNYGYSAAIGIFSSNKMPIENNVIYHTLDFSIRIEGNSNIIRNNLVTMNYWSATFVTWEAEFNKEYWGAIDAHATKSYIIENNFIAGAERNGIYFRGDVCDGQTSDSPISVKNNTIYGALSGITLIPQFEMGTSCIKISGFTVFKSSHYGLYYQQTANLTVDGNTFIDNRLGIYAMIVGPSILSHEVTNKVYKVQNSLFVGESKGFNCLNDIRPSDLNFIQAKNIKSTGAGEDGNGKVALVWTNFLSATNGAPYKPWMGIMSYNSLDGLMTVENVTFSDYNVSCNASIRNYVITDNIGNADGQQPVTFKNIKLNNVDFDSKIFIHRSDTGKINPSDCVDMHCDAQKKCLFSDLDGSFIGYKSSVIPQSEYMWGSQSIGLGDFRIPKDALAAPDGTMMNISDVYHYTGISRDENLCRYIDLWQAYLCRNITYKLLIIESMDNDTESRRLSPVAIFTDNNAYVDLINGPQDHGWCFGYTCQKRVSTFYALVQDNRNYDVYLSSTPPNRLRFRLVNSDASFKIRLSMHYTVAKRIDLYKNGIYMNPTNVDYSTGVMTLKDPSSNLNSYMPRLTNNSGTNLFTNRKIYFSMWGGNDYIDINIAPVLFVTFGVPAITPDSFFDPANLVNNFAALLGIPASKIRKVEIVRATSRKRSASGTSTISFTIFEDPVSSVNSQQSLDALSLSLKQLNANITNRYTTGELQTAAQSQLSVQLTSLQVQSPLSNKTTVPVGVMNRIIVVQDAADCREQSPCGTQPVLKVVDSNDNIVENVGSTEFPWVIQATITNSSDPTASIILQSQAMLVNGYVNFTKLGISKVLSYFKISYTFLTPTGVSPSSYNPLNANSSLLSSSEAKLTCKVNEEAIVVKKNKQFNITLSIVDQFTLIPVQNISWRNYTWSASITLFTLSKCTAAGSLNSSTSQVIFDSNTGLATFTNLVFSSSGSYVLSFSVRSSSNEFNFNCLSKKILVTSDTLVVPSTQPNVRISFDADYNKNLENIEAFKSMFYNCLILKFNISLTSDIYAYAGSIVFEANIADSSNVSGLVTETQTFCLNSNTCIKSASILGNSYTYQSNAASAVAEASKVNAELAKENGVKIGLIVGLTVGLLALIITPIIIFVIYRSYKISAAKKATVYPDSKHSKIKRMSNFLTSNFKKPKYHEKLNDD